MRVGSRSSLLTAVLAVAATAATAQQTAVEQTPVAPPSLAPTENPAYKFPINEWNTAPTFVNPYMQLDAQGDALPPAGVVDARTMNADLMARMRANLEHARNQQNAGGAFESATPPLGWGVFLEEGEAAAQWTCSGCRFV